MNIIPRYLLFSFLKTFALWFICIIGVYVVFDLFTNYERFFGLDITLFERLKLILVFYFYKSLPFFDMISGILAMASAMITIAMMMKSNELVPLLAAGISEVRVIKPVLLTGIVLILLAAVFREALLPNCQRMLAFDVHPEAILNDKGKPMNAAFDRKTETYLKGDTGFYSKRMFTNPDFTLKNDLWKIGAQNIQADEAWYIPANENHPNGYLLKNVKKPENLSDSPSVYLDEELLVITHRDAGGWLEPGECFFVTDVPFEYLADSDTWSKYASTPEMVRMLRSHSIDFGNDALSTLHGRIVQPLLDTILIVLGLSIVVIVVSGHNNIFIAIGLAGLIILSFFGLKLASQHFCNGFDMPALGAWIPLMVFVPVAVNLYLRVSK